ncbi:MAG: T9SS type A sorting domain-containing protein [Bacteroidetes bacterium]|nr:T9SS type A sorting domain-containing protein [Bacteroidota bacterium]
MNALQGGEASYISRNRLFYEVHDGALAGGSRIRNIQTMASNIFEVLIYPVPAKDNIYLTYKNDLPDCIYIYDGQQRRVLKSENVNSIDLSSLSAGCYFLEFMKDQKRLDSKKLIKLK